MTEWVVGTSIDGDAKRGKVYIQAKDLEGTMRTQAVASTPGIAHRIVKDHNQGIGGLHADRYLGDLVWMSERPRCPNHQVLLDLEWTKDNLIMWICGQCRSEDRDRAKTSRKTEGSSR